MRLGAIGWLDPVLLGDGHGVGADAAARGDAVTDARLTSRNRGRPVCGSTVLIATEMGKVRDVGDTAEAGMAQRAEGPPSLAAGSLISTAWYGNRCYADVPLCARHAAARVVTRR